MHEDARPPLQEGRALTRTCIVDTPYALGLYLLKTELADYAETRFYVDQHMPEEIAARLPNAKRMLVRGTGAFARVRANALRAMCFLEHFRNVRGTHVFAQDHISCASRLIGRLPYTLIEDGPGIYSRVDTLAEHCARPCRDMLRRLWSRLARGAVFGHTCGRSRQCVNRWVTQPADLDSPALANRTAELVDLRALWDSASREKRAEILRIFCGSRDPRADLGAVCETLFLTQPMMEDCGLSESEVRDVYAPYVGRYRTGGIAVKAHPRDGFAFTRAFPEARRVDTLLPMQLLCLSGMRFRRVVTVCSSAADSLPPEIEVVRIGTSANPKLVAAWGVR